MSLGKGHRSPWSWIWAAFGLALVIRTGVRDSGVITDHLEFGRRVLLGLDLYAPFLDGDKPLHAPYPPSFGILTAPFALLPERLARVLWGFVQVGCLWVVALRLRDIARRYAAHLLPKLQYLYVFAAVLGARYILRDTHGGGGNLINLALVLTAFQWAQRGWNVRSGLILGLSLATKPVAVLVLPLLWLLGHRRAPGIALFAAAGYLGISLALLRQGMTPFLTWFDGTVRYVGMNDLFSEPPGGFPPFTWMNQCLRCCVARYLGEVPPELAEEVPGFVSGLGLGATTAAWVSRGLSAMLMAATFTLIWRARRVRAAIPWSIAAILALSLLLSPISWKAHHVALLPAFFLLGTKALMGCRGAWTVAGAYLVFCVLGEEVVGKEFKNIQQSYYFTTAGTLAILGVCLWQVHHPQILPTVSKRR